MQIFPPTRLSLEHKASSSDVLLCKLRSQRSWRQENRSSCSLGFPPCSACRLSRFSAALTRGGVACPLRGRYQVTSGVRSCSGRLVSGCSKTQLMNIRCSVPERSSDTRTFPAVTLKALQVRPSVRVCLCSERYICAEQRVCDAKWVKCFLPFGHRVKLLLSR